MWNTDISSAYTIMTEITAELTETFWRRPVLTSAVAVASATAITVHIVETLVQRYGKAKPKNETVAEQPIRLRKRE